MPVIATGIFYGCYTEIMHAQERLNAFLDQKEHYRYTGNQLARKVLATIIAPTAVGKSTLIQHIQDQATEQGIEVGDVATWTTRNARPDDPPYYRTGLAMDTLLDAIEAGELVNWAPHPSGALYATGADSYPAPYNFLPTLPDALPMLRKAGFKAVHVYYLTAPVDAWRHHLEERREHDLASRLREAEQSLAWALNHEDELTILHNRTGEASLAQLSQIILDDIQGRSPAHSDAHAHEHLQAMQHYVARAHQDTSLE